MHEAWMESTVEHFWHIAIRGGQFTLLDQNWGINIRKLITPLKNPNN